MYISIIKMEEEFLKENVEQKEEGISPKQNRVNYGKLFRKIANIPATQHCQTLKQRQKETDL